MEPPPPSPVRTSQVSNRSKKEKIGRCPRSFFGRTRTDPQAGLGAPFLGCAHVEPPLPLSVQLSTAPPPPHPLPSLLLSPCVPQNTSLDTHEPSAPSPEHRETRTFVSKPRFSTAICWLVFFWRGSLPLPVFSSSIHEEERGRSLM